jgi:gibberellin 3-beta-dioxygenase
MSTRSTSDVCGTELSKVALRLLYLMVGSLGLPDESLEGLLGPDFHNKQVVARLHINHYPVCVEPDKTWGFHSHTDSTIITVLHQDDVGGLQVRFKDGSWHGVRPIDGALVVNVGNFLQVWSNRRFLSAEHRAVTNNKSGRVSVAYFVHRMGDFVHGPWPALVDADHPPRYRSFTAKEYFEKLFVMGMGKDRDQFLEQSFGTSL